MTPVARSRFLILISAAGVLLFFLHLLGALSGAETRLMRGLAPAEARLSGAAVSLRQLAANPFRVSDVMAENERLKKERDGLLVQLAGLKNVEDENAQLQTLLKFAKREAKPPVVARVLASTPEPGTHTILLDRGSDDGLQPDMPVVVGDGIIIGKIFKTDRATSVALLLTDTRSRIGASLQDAGRTQGVVQGNRGLSLEMQLIPQNQAIAQDDLIVTSGIEPLIPRGLVIGRVQEVQQPERNPFKTAVIVSPVSYDDLEIVAIPAP